MEAEKERDDQEEEEGSHAVEDAEEEEEALRSFTESALIVSIVGGAGVCRFSCLLYECIDISFQWRFFSSSAVSMRLCMVHVLNGTKLFLLRDVSER